MKKNIKLEMFLQNLEQQQLSKNETAVVLNNPVEDDIFSGGGAMDNSRKNKSDNCSNTNCGICSNVCGSGNRLSC